MHKHDGPFLSAAAIRRVLGLHAFSEVNRVYLLEEAARREDWEREVEALLVGAPSEAGPGPRGAVASCDAEEADAASHRHLQAAPPL